MRTFLRAAMVMAAVTFVSACASTQIASDVARFHRLPAPAGETFRIVPADATKKGSLEFETYAAQVKDQLVKVGFRPAEANGPTVYDVRLDYMISGGKEKIATRPGAGFAPYGFYGHGYGHWGRRGYWHDPFYSPYFDGFYDREVYSYTVYTRRLNLDIVRVSGGEQLFEGRVESIGADNRLPEVMPYLVQAMFTNFPGNSGVTQRVKIDVARN